MATTKSGVRFASCLTALLLLTLPGAPPRAAPEERPPGTILRLVNVGLVLTKDGTLWEYRPDRRRWRTIDESFQEQGKTTHILPLPVRAEAIREMVTWGFLLADSGQCWLYDLGTDKWEKIPPPPSRQPPPGR